MKKFDIKTRPCPLCILPERVGQPVAAQVEDLRVAANVGDGGEGGVDALHRLLAALPLARARLGALHRSQAKGRRGGQHGPNRRRQQQRVVVAHSRYLSQTLPSCGSGICIVTLRPSHILTIFSSLLPLLRPIRSNPLHLARPLSNFRASLLGLLLDRCP